jgi:hypothetical protein
MVSVLVVLVFLQAEKVGLSLYQAVETHRTVRCYGSHIIWTTGYKAVRL